MIASLNPLLHKALRKKFAVPALNVTSMETVQAVFSAAQKAKSPVILQVSPSALEYSGDLLPDIVFAEAKKFPKVPFALHLDHGRSFDECKKAMRLGFSSVMIDASINYNKKDSQGNHPARKFAENEKITRKVVLQAQSKNVSVEGEIGTLGGIEDSTKAKAQLTDPSEAKFFVDSTGIDALAVAIGTSHGAYKFKDKPNLHFKILKQTHEMLPQTPLVLHGASSVPRELVQKARKFGLNIGPDAKGLPLPQIQKAIKLGICKINIDTDARLAFMAGVLQKANAYKGPVDLRKYFGAGRTELEKLYTEKMRAFRSAGKI